MRGDYDCKAILDAGKERCRKERDTVIAAALKAISPQRHREPHRRKGFFTMKGMKDMKG